MKIGQVVRKYGIPADSIYFYIKSGLLVPQRKNSQYYFGERTLEDLEWILRLKDMDFSLKEIHRVLSLKRISNLSTNEDKLELVEMMEAQNETLHREQQRLEECRQKVQKEAAEWRQKMIFITEESGFPISMLGFLACPCCGGELGLSRVFMNQKAIFQADLQCTCGYHAVIRDGILETDHKNESLHDKPDTTRELYKDLPSETLSLFEQSYRSLERRISPVEHHGKVWLEGHVNAWFFFHNHLKLLKPEDMLIVTDKFPETLRSYRKVMEQQGIPCPVIYIADARDELPLKKGIVDRVMDFFGTNEHSFYTEEFYPDLLRPYLRDDAEAFGIYFHFRNGKKSMEALLKEYPECSKDNFYLRWFQEHLRKNYRIVETEDCGYSTDSGKNLGLGFHMPGEELHLTAWHAEVKNRPV